MWSIRPRQGSLPRRSGPCPRWFGGVRVFRAHGALLQGAVVEGGVGMKDEKVFGV